MSQPTLLQAGVAAGECTERAAGAGLEGINPTTSCINSEVNDPGVIWKLVRLVGWAGGGARLEVQARAPDRGVGERRLRRPYRTRMRRMRLPGWGFRLRYPVEGSAQRGNSCTCSRQYSSCRQRSTCNSAAARSAAAWFTILRVRGGARPRPAGSLLLWRASWMRCLRVSCARRTCRIGERTQVGSVSIMRWSRRVLQIACQQERPTAFLALRLVFPAMPTQIQTHTHIDVEVWGVRLQVFDPVNLFRRCLQEKSSRLPPPALPCARTQTTHEMDWDL